MILTEKFDQPSQSSETQTDAIRRLEALAAYGIDISALAPDVLTSRELVASPPPKPIRKANPFSLPLPEPTRELSDTEWQLLAPILPDNSWSRIKNRRAVDLLIKFVIQGVPWSQLGGRDGNALREKVARRARGQQKWNTAATVALQQFEDTHFGEQVYRTLRWMYSGDVSLVAWRRGIGATASRQNLAKESQG